MKLLTWECPLCGVHIGFTDPANVGITALFHFSICEGLTMTSTEPRPQTEIIVELLDGELVKHQGYATEARARGLSGLAAYYDTMSLGIVECIRSIRCNIVGGSTAWRTPAPQTDSPQLSDGQNGSTH